MVSKEFCAMVESGISRLCIASRCSGNNLRMCCTLCWTPNKLWLYQRSNVASLLRFRRRSGVLLCTPFRGPEIKDRYDVSAVAPLFYLHYLFIPFTRKKAVSCSPMVRNLKTDILFQPQAMDDMRRSSRLNRKSGYGVQCLRNATPTRKNVA